MRLRLLLPNLKPSCLFHGSNYRTYPLWARLIFSHDVFTLPPRALAPPLSIPRCQRGSVGLLFVGYFVYVLGFASGDVAITDKSLLLLVAIIFERVSGVVH